jgi:hypothetical protein
MRQDKQSIKESAEVVKQRQLRLSDKEKCCAAFQKQNAGAEQWPWFYAGWIARGKSK